MADDADNRSSDNAAADAFIELSTSQLPDRPVHLLGVDAPHATAQQDYMFERPITSAHGDGSTSAGRIDLADLRKPEVRERLRRIWTNPLSVDNRFVTAKA
ncbi:MULTISPECIES: hypothetical protein [unclassified Lysobacter]